MNQMNGFTHHSSPDHCLLLAAFLIKTDTCTSLPLSSQVIMSQTHIKSREFNRKKLFFSMANGKSQSGGGVGDRSGSGSGSGSSFYSHFSLHIFRCDSIRRDSVAFVGTILGCPSSSSLHLYNRLLQRGICGLFHLCRSNLLPVVCS